MINRFINFAVKGLYESITREQRRMLMCDYKDIDKIPDSFRKEIAEIHLKEESHLRNLFNRCDVTDTDIMVDIILRNLYFAVNYRPEDESNYGFLV